jgi:hypothetical protein
MIGAGSMPVCADCFEDQDLISFVRNHASDTCCNYCGRDSEEDCDEDEEPEAIAADSETVFEYIRERIEANYSTNEVECIPYDNEDGQYILPVWNTYELFCEELGGFPTGNDALIKDIVESLPDVEWCRADPQILSPLEGIRSGWEEFCRTIKHKTHFLFFSPATNSTWKDIGYEPNAVEPGEMLSRIGDLIRDYQLVRQIPAQSAFYRAHCSASTFYDTAADLGPPPPAKASGGRMNPVGIAMTYVSEDPETVLAETVALEHKFASVSRWETLESLRVLDLLALPEPIGLFAENSGTHDAEMIAFLRDFRRTIVEPVRAHANSKEPLEYIPSQVVTEYLRLRFSDLEGPIQGIRYPSVKNVGGVNLVFFWGQDGIEGVDIESLFKPKSLLRLLDFSHKEVNH